MDRAGQYDGELGLPSSPVSVDDLRPIPAGRGIYVLFSANGDPVTAISASGMRASLAGRLKAVEKEVSAKRADLSQVSSVVRWRLTHSRFESDMTHLEIVRNLWPNDFADKLPRRRAWFVRFEDMAGIPRLVTVGAFSPAASVAPAETGQHFFGPFPARKAADRFIELLTDIFDLCRYNSIIRQSPNGRPCAYAQMGRCQGPCSGDMDMADYRSLFNSAWDFACGQRDSWRDHLADVMKRCAAEVQFEQASVLKARLESIAQLDAPRFIHADRADRSGFVLIQRGPKRKLIRLFTSSGGRILDTADLAYPVPPQELSQLINRFNTLELSNSSIDPHGLAIIVQYLYSTQIHSGIVIPAKKLTAQIVMQQLEQKGQWLGRLSANSDDDDEQVKEPNGNSLQNQDSEVSK